MDQSPLQWSIFHAHVIGRRHGARARGASSADGLRAREYWVTRMLRHGQLRVPRLAVTQGVFFIATGLWPIVHMRSFESVTGPKREGWLTKTMGGLIAVVGATLASNDRDRSAPLALLGFGSALALGVSDVVYVAKGRIAPVYLVDAAVEFALAGAWLRRCASLDESPTEPT
jgi:hypothetical protein